MTRSSTSSLRIVLVYPELLGTYGDGGNAEILVRRAGWHGLDATLVEVTPGTAIPSQGDIYLLGGGEDEPQMLAAEELASSGTSGVPGVRRAVEEGAVLLGVCAGFQLLGTTFPGADGKPRDGVGLLDARTVPGPTRAVGDVVSVPGGELAELPVLLGFENHGGRTALGAATTPLGRVEIGIGNDETSHVDGAVARVGGGLVVGSYLHGPLLALNHALADWLITQATGLPPLGEQDDPAAAAAERLRSDRLAALTAAHGRLPAPARRSATSG